MSDADGTPGVDADRPSDTERTPDADAERTRNVERPPNAERRTDDERDGRRDVVVPMRLYKTVTVFSTLIAVLCVVVGFMLLDAATLNVSFLGGAVTGALSALGVSVADGVVSTVLAALGLASIGFGAGVYTLGTRFRAPGMGKSQEDSAEESDTNG